MKQVLLIGAGRSSSAYIQLFYQQKFFKEFKLVVIDRVSNQFRHPDITFEQLDVSKKGLVTPFIKSSSLVVSLLPPSEHFQIAKLCVALKVDFLTASYTDNKIARLHQEAKGAGITLLMECGLDPGIDHLVAKEMIDNVKAEGGHILSFKSYAGGLVAPEYDDNPWHYKISWNPDNVIKAGERSSSYIKAGKVITIPKELVFKDKGALVIHEVGELEFYPNRDSSTYQELYGLYDADVFRGTLRGNGYIDAWAALIDIGWTTAQSKPQKAKTFFEVTQNLLGTDHPKVKVIGDLSDKYGVSAVSKLDWLGVFSDEETIGNQVTICLKELMMSKMSAPNGQDMVVMHHELLYENDGKKLYTKTLKVKGRTDYSAMSFTVGVTLLSASVLLLSNKLNIKGVCRPIGSLYYKQILPFLRDNGISFVEKIVSV